MVTPRSRCPGCGRPIPWRENVPLLSFLLLRGKCRGCAAPISWRYPFVEALTGGLFALAAWLILVRYGGRSLDPGRLAHLGAAFLYLGALVALTFIDLDHRILPDRITKPGMAAGGILSVLLPALQDPPPFAGLPPEGRALALSVAGMLVGYGGIWLVALLGERMLGREAMGMGDAKLLGMIGAFCGPVGVLLAASLGLVVGLLAGALRLLRTGDASFPFGPALAAGGAAVFVARPEVERGFGAATDWLSEPVGGIAVTVLCLAMLLWIRTRLPRRAFLALLGLVLLLGGLNAWLLLRGPPGGG